MSKTNTPDSLPLELLMASIDELLTAHHATKPDLLSVADRLLVSVFAETAEEQGPRVAQNLAEGTLAIIRDHISQRIAHPPQPLGEA